MYTPDNKLKHALLSFTLAVGIGGCEDEIAEDEIAEDEIAEDKIAEDEIAEKTVAEMGTSKSDDIDRMATESHCVLQEGEPDPVCFPNFSEAIAFSTGEVLDPDFPSADYPLYVTGKNRPRANKVVALGYLDKNYSGSSLQFVSSSGDCGLLYPVKSFATLPGWDNVLSSFAMLQGVSCTKMELYENANFGGAKLSIGLTKADLGALDNKVSSVKVLK